MPNSPSSPVCYLEDHMISDDASHSLSASTSQPPMEIPAADRPRSAKAAAIDVQALPNDATAKTAAAKARIISHMNADHADSIRRYLIHYFSLSSFSTRNAYLTDASLAYLCFSTRPPSENARGSKVSQFQYLIPLDPPLSSWSEARSRMVELDNTAIKSLGLSSITVKSWRRPRSALEIILTAGTLSAFVFLHREGILDNATGTILGRRIPGVLELLQKIQPWVFWPLLIAHAIEAMWLAWDKLRRHSVPLFSGLWWKWVLGTLAEGFTSPKRFDEMVEEERKRKAAAKH